jgi:hypothetical protein
VRPQKARIFLNGLVFGIVFALGVFGCGGEKPKVFASLNRTASLLGELPANPLEWRVITSSASRNDSTMSTLYGNDVAIQYARTNSDHKYPNGSALSLVTWAQQEDGRWFGAKIPATVKSVEFVLVSTAADGHLSYSYQKFQGTPLKQSSAQEYLVPRDRAAELLSERAAVMP